MGSLLGSWRVDDFHRPTAATDDLEARRGVVADQIDTRKLTAARYREIPEFGPVDV